MRLQSKKMAFLFIGILFICQCHLIAQAVFKVSISPESIGKEETATLRLMIDNAKQVEQISPPALGDFDVISGPNQESGMEINNGVTRQYIGITYLLRPKSIGKFSITGAKAVADGKTLVGNSVTLTVTKIGSGNNSNNIVGGFGGLSSLFEPVAQSAFNDYILKKGENPKQKINKNIFLKVITNKNSCFIGEPIIVTYKLYTRLKSESNVTKNPSFNGFSVIDLMAPGNTNYSIERLNGREYNVYTLRKSQLYPLQAGAVELESAEVDNTIHFIKEEYFTNQRNEVDEFFGNLIPTTIPPEGMLDEKVTLQSKPVAINVKPLPEVDKPASFSYFNVAQGKYIKLNSTPLTLTISKGTGKKVFDNYPSPKAQAENISLGLSVIIWLISISTAVLLTILAFMWYRKNKKKATPAIEPISHSSVAAALPEFNTALPLSPFALSEEKMIQGNSNEFYNTLNNELRKFLADRLQIPLETISKKTIVSVADQQGMAIYTRLQIEQLLDDIEWQLYTPMTSENSMEELYNRAITIAAALATPSS